MRDGLLRLRLLAADAKPRVGQRVVTLGSAKGGPYLPGVPVGTIVRVERDADPLVTTALVRPAVRFSTLDVVGVVSASRGGDRCPVAPSIAALLVPLLQVTVVNRLPLPGAAPPDLVLAAVALVAAARGPVTGTLTGFAAGLAADLLPPADAVTGRSALVFAVVGYRLRPAAPGAGARHGRRGRGRRGVRARRPRRAAARPARGRRGGRAAVRGAVHARRRPARLARSRPVQPGTARGRPVAASGPDGSEDRRCVPGSSWCTCS